MRYFPGFLLFVAIFLTLPLTSSAEIKKTEVAVLDFHVQGGELDRKDMEATIASWVAAAIIQDGRFDIVDRARLERVLEEQKIYKSSRVDASGAAQIGRALGVEFVLTGSIISAQDMSEINTRLIDAESAAIIAAENLKIPTGSSLQDSVAEISHKIMKNIQLEGYIVNRRNDTVTLDLGIDSGVKIGMRFVVFKEGQDIKHPKTGEVLSIERIQTGIVTITEVTQKVCTAQIDEETSPGLISYGQMVKNKLNTRSEETRLFINATPANARIRILNIGPGYLRGMALAPGSYHIEISAPGYVTRKEWINLGENEAKSVSFDLLSTAAPKKASAASRQSQPYLTAQQTRYLHLLQSRNDDNMRDAAKDIVRMRLTDTVILDAVERALSDGYMHDGRGYEHADAMSWLCKALGASGHGKYRLTLRTVAHNAPSLKLRSYAERSLREL